MGPRLGAVPDGRRIATEFDHTGLFVVTVGIQKFAERARAYKQRRKSNQPRIRRIANASRHKIGHIQKNAETGAEQGFSRTEGNPSKTKKNLVPGWESNPHPC